MKSGILQLSTFSSRGIPNTKDVKNRGGYNDTEYREGNKLTEPLLLVLLFINSKNLMILNLLYINFRK